MPTYDELRTNAEKIADAAVKKRVLQGLELLHVKYGDDWIDHIDPTTLDMANSRFCVLGQVYGDYEQGVVALDINEIDGYEADYGFMNAHGYQSYDGRYISFEELDEAWLTVIGYYG
jgi:hypothetical protein